MLSGTATGLLRDAFMSALPEEARALAETFDEGATCKSCSDALIGVGDDPYLTDADNYPCSRQGSGGGISSGIPLSSGIFLFIIDAVTGCDLKMSGKELITPEDLNVIREGYDILSNIVLSAPAAHETPQDNRPGYLCLNEYMLGAGAFNVPPARVVPHSWKVIQTMAWCYEHKGCSADRYLWRELLTRRLSHGYVELLARRDVKGIADSPDCMPGWEVRFFFAWLVSERDIWGVSEPLLDPIPRSRLSLPARQRWALLCFRGTTLRWHSLREEFFRLFELVHFAVAKEEERRAPKRVRPSEEVGNQADFGPSIERASGSSSSGQLTPGVELEGMAPPPVVARLKEESEASHAEVAQLQSMPQGDVARPSAVAEYLRSEAYRRRMEFEQAHHSQSG
ncbi:hypothetical protein ACLOJK_004139 [Asimina triloba]